MLSLLRSNLVQCSLIRKLVHVRMRNWQTIDSSHLCACEVGALGAIKDGNAHLIATQREFYTLRLEPWRPE
jgi:hypothetical protein